jgi:peptidoglycan L-alanyl-D-glutamate endopeptidase CwlK
MEKITEDRINKLHPKVREEVRDLINKANAALTSHSQIRIVQGLRTFEEQNALYLKRPKVTNAKGGQSYHNYGLAIDFCLIIDGKEVIWNTSKDFDGDQIADWLEVVQIFVKAGWYWGKAFNDLPHLEKTFGLNWRDMLKKYKASDFIPNTKYINL